MDLDDAYRILEVERGADEDTIREARKTLAKVWHPDRHANDPELQKRAQDKLADVNAAFEMVSKAGFPAKPAARPIPKAEPPPPRPPAAVTPPPPPEKSTIEFVPARRVRWSVILVLALALGLGAYVAITKLGGSSSVPVVRDSTVVMVVDAALAPEPDAAVVVVADVADVVPEDAASGSGGIVRRERTFTLGSTKDEVIAAQGQPQGTSTRSSTINGVRTASTTLSWGESTSIDFDGNDKVIGWSEGDSPLHVRIEVRNAAIAAAAKARGTVAIGSGIDDVLGVLGPPTALRGTQWSYGTSTLDIERGKVVRITQGEPKLPVAN